MEECYSDAPLKTNEKETTPSVRKVQKIRLPLPIEVFSARLTELRGMPIASFMEAGERRRLKVGSGNDLLNLERLDADVREATKYHRVERRVYREIRELLSKRLGAALERSRKKGREDNVTLDDLCRLYDAQNGQCALTGIPFDCGENRGGDTKWKRPFSVSIDRIDSRLGYTVDNTRLVCSAVNAAMGAWGEGVFRLIAAALLSRE